MSDSDHRGAQLEKILRSYSINFKELAANIHYRTSSSINRGTLYNWFTDPDISHEKIAAIVKAIPRLGRTYPGLAEDIEKAFPQMSFSQMAMEAEADYAMSSNGISAKCMEMIDHWRGRFITASDRIIELQEELLTLRRELNDLRGRN